MPKDMLTLKDYTGGEIEHIIDRAIEIKGNQDKYHHVLDNKTLTMLFQKTSTRTRASFETGMTQLGGHAIFLDWRTTQFQLADLRDEAKVIGRYSDIVMARLLKHDDLLKMAEATSVPLINGLTEKYHPCQILCDLMTIKEKKGSLKGLTLAYFGMANNTSNSLTVGCTKTGMNFVLCSPERDQVSLDQELLDEAKATGLYTEETDPKKAIENADVVYTDSWINMEYFLDPKFKEEKERRIKAMAPYQVNKALLEGSDVLFMHLMPVHRGYEVDDWVMDDYPNNAVFDQAENRLHGQKALMLFLLGKL